MSFKDVIGNKRTIDFLKIIFLSHRETKAYLFVGQEGIGKKLIAYNIAKAINCLEKEEFDPCDMCSSCRRIDSGNHPDVFCIFPDTSGSIKIEQIRALKERVYIKTYEAKKKIFIIDDAEKMTLEAANACLKILEEPPSDSLFILISSRPKLIISTILSRCHKITFLPIDKRKLKEILLNNFQLEEILAHYLAYFCEGRIGKAISLSKQPDILVQKNRIIDEFLNSSSIYENRDINRDRLRQSMEILLSWFRDLYVIKSEVGFAELINLDRQNHIFREASRYSLMELEHIIKFISDGFFYLEQNVNPKLLSATIKARILR